MTPLYPHPSTLWTGDGLSDFREIVILDFPPDGNVYFAPTHSWREFFLTYHLPVEVFHRVYKPCPPESQPEEKPSSKIGSLWRRLFSMIARWF